MSRISGQLRLVRGLVLYKVSLFALNYPIFLRGLFATLRELRPIGVISRSYWISKHDDVSEVLSRLGDFTVHEDLAPGMPWGPFLLTTDWPDLHQRDRQWLARFAETWDVETIDRLVQYRCRAVLDAADAAAEHRHEATTTLDFASEYAEPVVLDVIEYYFGVPPMTDRTVMARTLRLLSSNIMAQPPAGSKLYGETQSAIEALTMHLMEVIEHAVKDARAGALIAQPRNTVLQRMALTLASRPAGNNDQEWFTEDWIRRFLTGLLATAAGTMVRASSHVLDRLIALPAALTATSAAAHALTGALQSSWQETEQQHAGKGLRHDLTVGPRGAFERHLLEALRFRPMLPLLVRHCPRGVILSHNTDRARTIPGGASVKVGLISGMFDRDKFSNPRAFDGDRSSAPYLHFGVGPRYCFGTYVARNVMIELLRPLLLKTSIARAPGWRGRVRYEAAAVKTFLIQYDCRREG